MLYSPTYGERRLGHKRYEISNHLGNVLAVISDRKEGIDSDADGLVNYYTADVIQAQDYSPFGMELVGRTYTSGGSQNYRYGFNGKEQDADVMGQGTRPQLDDQLLLALKV